VGQKENNTSTEWYLKRYTVPPQNAINPLL
jgi:hypothetical protein